MNDLKNKGKDPYVLVVITHEGSSPGKKGAKMIISESEEFGSIGGGVMERNLRNQLSQLILPTIIEFEHKKGKNSSGLLCSGSQKVFVFQPNKTEIEEILDAYEIGNLVINYTADGIEISEKPSLHHENLTIQHYLHIFGGGHVGYALSRVFENLDFLVNLYDHRNIHNSYVDCTINTDYSEFHHKLNDKDYVVVVSYGIDYDLKILTSLYNSGSQPRYLGVMGSKSKLLRLIHQLKELKVDDSFIERIIAPIGLEISNGTPEEIAISIAAQVLQFKNSMK